MTLRRPAKDQPNEFEFKPSSLAAMKYIAKFLDMPYIKVYEVATFYSMYNNAITALFCFPSGYLEIILFAAFKEDELNSKFSG